MEFVFARRCAALVAGVLLLGACSGGGSGTSGAAPSSEGSNGGSGSTSSATPSDSFDLTHWRLTIPADANGGNSGAAVSIEPDELAAGYSSQWFYSGSDGAMVFWAPVDGATTGNSDYPRSELRELIDGRNSDTNWTDSDGGTLAARRAVTKVPSASGAVIVGQIHGYGDGIRPLAKLVYRYQNGVGSLEADIDTAPTGSGTASFPLASSIPLGQAFDYQIGIAPGNTRPVLSISVNGNAVTYSLPAEWDGVGLYFKAGAYVIATGDSSADGGQVAFYRLSATHP